MVVDPSARDRFYDTSKFLPQARVPRPDSSDLSADAELDELGVRVSKTRSKDSDSVNVDDVDANFATARTIHPDFEVADDDIGISQIRIYEGEEVKFEQFDPVA